MSASASIVTPFAALDAAGARARFTRSTAQPGVAESFLAIEGMHCAACAQSIRERLGRLPGVQAVEVNVAAGAASVRWQPQVTRLSLLFESIAALGYKPYPADDYLALARQQKAHKKLLWQFLVALLAMMQTMMYAWPRYIADAGELPGDVDRLFALASWMMTVPVVLFSARPLFASAWAGLRQRTVSMDLPVAIAIVIMFVASSLALHSGGDTYFDSLTMFVTFLLGGRLIEQRLREKINAQLTALSRRLPQLVERVTGSARAAVDAGLNATGTALASAAAGAIERITIDDVAVGDLLRVPIGAAIAADGVVVDGESSIDQAILTGESEPLPRGVGSELLAGCINLTAPLLMRVTRIGASSRYGQIVQLMQRAATQRPPLVLLADRFAHGFVIAVLFCALAAAWWWTSVGAHDALAIAVSVLIVTCPCALSLAAPMTTMAAIGRLLRDGVLVAQPRAIEALAGIDQVVFDKTGTLTESLPGLSAMQLLRQDYPPQQAAAIALALARESLHPLSRAIVAAAAGTASTTATATNRLPLDDQAQALVPSAVTEQAGAGISGELAGVRYRLGRPAQVVQADDGDSCTELSDADGPIAQFRFASVPRADTREAIATLQAGSIATAILSGDRSAAVGALARRLGIERWFAAATPQDKLAHLQQLQAAGRRIAFVGDGANDGPVLRAADVSIAMGSAVPLAQTSADLVLLRDRIGDVVQALAVARRAHAITRQNLAWALVYNLVCVPLALAGLMPPWLAGLGMAISSLLVMFNASRVLR